MVSIAPVKPGRDFAFELGPIGNAAVQALAGQDRQLRFRSYSDAGLCVFRLSCTSTIFSALAT